MLRFVVIGITDHPQPFFPPEVMEVISHCSVFSGGRRHHELVAPLLPAGARWIDITSPLSGVFARYRAYAATLSDATVPSGFAAGERTTATVVVFASGDPLFFGFANTIRRLMPEAGVVVYPAFNSLQTLAHRLLMPYHDMRIVSLTGRPWPALDAALIERAAKIGVLTDGDHTPAAIAQRMADYGFRSYTMHVGEHLGNPDKERLTTCSIDQATQLIFDSPNCVILEAKNLPARVFGLPDSEFELLDGREKMITKMPLRLLTLQMLDLPRRHTLWDIGACTGSVSIEARRLFPHLSVVAFEVRPECEAIVQTNARRHGAPGIALHIGDFLQADVDAIAEEGGRPDAVFIGGHGGRLRDILARVQHYLAPGGVIVMNSVSDASHDLFLQACHELGLHLATPLHVVVNDNNPINIMKCEQPS